MEHPMTYNHCWVYLRVNAILTSSPRCRLLDLVQMLKIGRHTIEKAVLQSTAMTFRHYQNKKVLESCNRLFAQEEGVSGKEIAFRMGYKHAASLARCVKRSTGRNLTSLRTLTGIWPADSNNAPQMLHNSPKC
jgi:methylphosphotriester-DNA--protein-cysteine methyltransferase